MMTFQRIACAVDFSEESRAAVADAAELARRFGVELTLVHVHLPPPQAAIDALGSSELAELDAEEVEQQLAVWKAEAERLADRPVKTALLAGSPGSELVRYARDRHVDLIVLGTHGRTGLRRAVLGSVAEHVVRHAHCPVLVVRRPAH